MKRKLLSFLVAFMLVFTLVVPALALDVNYTDGNQNNLQTVLNDVAASGGGTVTITTAFHLSTSITVPSGVILEVNDPSNVFFIDSSGHITIEGNAGFILYTVINVNNSGGGYGFTINPGGFAAISGNPDRLQDYVQGNRSWVGDLGFVVREFLITYDVNGGNVASTPAPTPKALNATVYITSAVPTWAGHNFMGWNTAADGSGTAYNAGDSYTTNANLRLYAQWILSSFDVVVNDSYAVTDGTGTYNTGSTVTINAGSRTGYNFTGWFVDSANVTLGNASTATTTFTMPAADVEVTATWAIKDNLTVTYNGNTADGGTPVVDSSSPYTYGDTVTVLANTWTKTGYDFVEWNTAANGGGTAYDPADTFNMPDGNVVLYAQWKIKDYLTVTYDGNTADGGTAVVDSNNPYTYGNTVTVRVNTWTKTGYDFTGWNTLADGSGTDYDPADTFSMPDGNVVLYAQWEIKDYLTVTYNGNTSDGGTAVVDSNNPYTYGDTVTVLGNTWTKTGYDFTGWNTAANGGGTAYDPADTFNMPDGNVVLYAQWEIKDYLTVTYDGNTADGGTAVVDTNSPYEYDAQVTVLWNTWTKNGYDFTGWNTEADGTGTAYDPADTFSMPDGNVVLYAQWAIRDYLTVTYDGNTADGGTAVVDSNNPYTYGDTVTVLDNTWTKTGYDFVEWNTEVDGGGTAYDPADTFDMPDSDVVLYAQWEIKDYLTVTYDGNTADGGTAVVDGNNPYTFGDTVTVLDNTWTKTGYDFVEWNTEVDGGGMAYDPADTFDMPDDDVVLYAQWAIKDYLTVTYDGNTSDGGTAVVDSNNPYTYGDTVTVLDNTWTKTGYDFVSWNTAADGSGTDYDPADTFDMPDGDVVLYAQWSNAIDYKITYILNGGTNDPANPATYTVEDKEIILKDPTKAGYGFVEWTPTDTIPARSTGDKEFTAIWSDAISYTINYEMNGGTNDDDNPSTYTIEDTPITLNNPTRSGYNFAGWTVTLGNITLTDGKTIPLGTIGNLTLTANWTPVEGGGTVIIPSYPPPTTGIPDPEVPLADLDLVNHFAYIIGYEDSTVRPQNNITRAEVSTIFFRLLTLESREELWNKTNDFPDVAANSWYNNAISTLSNGGILQGYPDGTFRPNATITRAELATIAVRFQYNGDLSSFPPGLDGFTDIGGHWAENYIKLANELGYVNGYPDGTFRPNAPITRAEVATLLNNVLNRHVESKEDMMEGMKTWVDNPEGVWFYFTMQEATNSHYFDRKDDGSNEVWTEIRENPIWALLEKPDSTPYDITY